MKRTGTLVLIMLLLSTAILAADGPYQQGALIIGGSVSFTNQSDDAYEGAGSVSQTTITAIPSIGLFTADRTMIGFQMIVNYYDWGEWEESTFGFGPLFSYYFVSDPDEATKGRWIPYVGAFAAFSKEKWTIGDYEVTNYKIFRFGVRGGVDYMISNSVGLSLGAIISRDRFEVPSGASASGTTIQLAVGIDTFLF